MFFLFDKQRTMNVKHTALMLSLILIGGFGFVLLRLGIDQLNLIWFNFLRLVVAVPFMAWVLRSRRLTLELDKHWRFYLFLAITNIIIPWLTVAWAIQTVYASLLYIVTATVPMFSALFIAVWMRHWPSYWQCVGLGLGVIGVALLMGVDGDTATVSTALLIAFLSPVSYGMAAVYLKINAEHRQVEPLQTTQGSLLFALLLFLPMLLFVPVPNLGAMSVQTAGIVVVMGVFNTALVFLCIYKLTEALGPTPALAANYVIPVVGIVLARIVLGEPTPAGLVSGGALAILGTVLVTESYRPLLAYLRSKWQFS